MYQFLADFNFDENSIGDTIIGITYRWADENDMDNVLACIKDACDDFTKYYKDKRLYEKGNEIIILVAEQNSEIVGTLHVCMEIEGKGIGSVGCTTTMNKHQGKGIATTMIKLGTKYLKDIGLTGAFLGYTYTNILGMYGKAGYKPCMEYFMGEKTATSI